MRTMFTNLYIADINKIQKNNNTQIKYTIFNKKLQKSVQNSAFNQKNCIFVTILAIKNYRNHVKRRKTASNIRQN